MHTSIAIEVASMFNVLYINSLRLKKHLVRQKFGLKSISNTSQVQGRQIRKILIFTHMEFPNYVGLYGLAASKTTKANL